MDIFVEYNRFIEKGRKIQDPTFEFLNPPMENPDYILTYYNSLCMVRSEAGGISQSLTTGESGDANHSITRIIDMQEEFGVAKHSKKSEWLRSKNGSRGAFEKVRPVKNGRT